MAAEAKKGHFVIFKAILFIALLDRGSMSRFIFLPLDGQTSIRPGVLNSGP